FLYTLFSVPRLPSLFNLFPTRRSSDLAVSDSRFNFAAGQLQQTEVPTHVAIKGEGFFRIEGDGFDYFTRDGEFHINAENQLVNKDRKSTRLNSSHVKISYAVFCLKKKK